MLETAVDAYIDGTRDDIGEIDDPALVEREDDEDFVANLEDNVAPLSELVSLPLTDGNKTTCPFHDDPEPSCTLYPDHFHCFGCGEHGSRLDWLMRVEGMTEAEAIAYIKDWPGPAAPLRPNGEIRRRAIAIREAYLALGAALTRFDRRTLLGRDARKSTSPSCRQTFIGLCDSIQTVCSGPARICRA